MPLTRVLDGDIVCIDTEQSRPELAACYLIGSHGHYAFIESGTSHSVPGILQAAAQHGVRPDQVDYVILTHVHLDHAGGAGALMQQLPHAKLVVHPRGARHMIDPSRLIAGATAVYGEAFMQKAYGTIVPVPEARVLVPDLAPGKEQTLTLGERTFTLINAPGHAKHHLAIWDAQTRGWFTGDVFGLSYREFEQGGRDYILPTTTPIDFDPEGWEQTLQRMLAEHPACMYLTHYSRVTAVEQLAGELRTGLAAYQRIARAAPAGAGRHAAIAAGLMDWHLQELNARYHPMAPERVRALLDMDVEINAQGLEVWLDRQAAKPR